MLSSKSGIMQMNLTVRVYLPKHRVPGHNGKRNTDLNNSIKRNKLEKKMQSGYSGIGLLQ